MEGLNIAGRRRGGDRWRGKHVTVDHASPFVKELFLIMNFERVTMMEVAKRAGINTATLANWRRRNVPKIDNLEAAFNVLGYGLRIVRIDDDEA